MNLEKVWSNRSIQICRPFKADHDKIQVWTDQDGTYNEWANYFGHLGRLIGPWSQVRVKGDHFFF